MRKRGTTNKAPPAEVKRRKKRIFDRDAISPGVLFGAGMAWLIMYGLQVSKYGATTFRINLWLMPTLIFFGMAIFATIILLRKREEERWEKRND